MSVPLARRNSHNPLVDLAHKLGPTTPVVRSDVTSPSSCCRIRVAQARSVLVSPQCEVRIKVDEVEVLSSPIATLTEYDIVPIDATK
jgi:hypothetical protein